jgi:adenylylsulfate kinase
MPGRAAEPGAVLWLTGLPASGKSTLAEILAASLADRGHEVQVLDADALRTVLTPRPVYTPEERDWFYDILVFLADLLARHGIIVLIAATGHRRSYRERARRRLPRFAEIFVRCPLEVCRRRDPKGLYARSSRGTITTLPGAQEPYEAPDRPEAVADTELASPAETAAHVLRQLEKAGVIAPSVAAPN